MTPQEMFSRSFGVELEVLRPYSLDAFHKAASLLTQAGFPCDVVPYGSAHRVHSRWKVTHDGTVRSLTSTVMSGMEVVSPPMRGAEGLEEVAKVAALLKANGTTVNKTCGMHVHVHVANDSTDAKARLAVDYARHEKIIDWVLAPSRRGARGADGYARSIAHASTEEIMRTRDAMGLASLLAGNRSGGRRTSRSYGGTTKYVKLNFTPHYSYGTVEFRHHQGTVEPEKVRQWVRFCLRMAAKAAKASDRGDPVDGQAARVVTQRARPVRAGTKREIIVNLLLRPEGATTADVLAATGWPTVSMPDQARMAGLTLRSTRGYGNALRYYATRQESPTTETRTVAARRTLDTLLDSLEMPEEDKTYWRARHAWFVSRAAPGAYSDDTELMAAVA